MRIGLLFPILVVFTTCAAAQVTVISGDATSLAPGAYALPFQPQLTTPELQFSTPPLEVGASSATFGLAGARNSTSDVVSPPKQNSGAFYTPAASSLPETGAAMSQESFGLAQLTGNSRDHKKALRTFTNEDVDRLKQ